MVGVSAAVLAGGSSRRMGTDKRALIIDGVPLLRHAVLTASAISRDVMVVVADGRAPPLTLLEGLDWRLVLDRRAAGGPLAGLEAALWSSQSDLLLVLPTDMPQLTPELLRLVLERLSKGRSTCAALVHQGAIEPFPLAIRRHALDTVARLLEAQQRSMHGLLSTVETEEIPERDWRPLDPKGQALLNVNVPKDVAWSPLPD